MASSSARLSEELQDKLFDTIHKDGTYFSYMFHEKVAETSKKCPRCGAPDRSAVLDGEEDCKIFLGETGVVGKQDLRCDSCGEKNTVYSCDDPADLPRDERLRIRGSEITYYCKKVTHYEVLHDLLELLQIAATEDDELRRQKHSGVANFVLHNASRVCEEWCKVENSDLRLKKFLRLWEETILDKPTPKQHLPNATKEFKEMYEMMATSFISNKDKVLLLLDFMKESLFDCPSRPAFMMWVSIAMMHCDSYREFKSVYKSHSFMKVDMNQYQALKDRYLALDVPVGIQKIPVVFILFEIPRFFHFVDFLTRKLGKKKRKFLTEQDRKDLSRIEEEMNKTGRTKVSRSGRMVSTEMHLDYIHSCGENERELFYNTYKQKEEKKEKEKVKEKPQKEEEEGPSKVDTEKETERVEEEIHLPKRKETSKVLETYNIYSGKPFAENPPRVLSGEDFRTLLIEHLKEEAKKVSDDEDVQKMAEEAVSSLDVDVQIIAEIPNVGPVCIPTIKPVPDMPSYDPSTSTLLAIKDGPGSAMIGVVDKLMNLRVDGNTSLVVTYAEREEEEEEGEEDATTGTTAVATADDTTPTGEGVAMATGATTTAEVPSSIDEASASAAAADQERDTTPTPSTPTTTTTHHHHHQGPLTKISSLDMESGKTRRLSPNEYERPYIEVVEDWITKGDDFMLDGVSSTDGLNLSLDAKLRAMGSSDKTNSGSDDTNPGSDTKSSKSGPDTKSSMSGPDTKSSKSGPDTKPSMSGSDAKSSKSGSDFPKSGSGTTTPAHATTTETSSSTCTALTPYHHQSHPSGASTALIPAKSRSTSSSSSSSFPSSAYRPVRNLPHFIRKPVLSVTQATTSQMLAITRAASSLLSVDETDPPTVLAVVNSLASRFRPSIYRLFHRDDLEYAGGLRFDSEEMLHIPPPPRPTAVDDDGNETASSYYGTTSAASNPSSHPPTSSSSSSNPNPNPDSAASDSSASACSSGGVQKKVVVVAQVESQLLRDQGWRINFDGLLTIVAAEDGALEEVLEGLNSPQEVRDHLATKYKIVTEEKGKGVLKYSFNDKGVESETYVKTEHSVGNYTATPYMVTNKPGENICRMIGIKERRNPLTNERIPLKATDEEIARLPFTAGWTKKQQQVFKRYMEKGVEATHTYGRAERQTKVGGALKEVSDDPHSNYTVVRLNIADILREADSEERLEKLKASRSRKRKNKDKDAARSAASSSASASASASSGSCGNTNASVAGGGGSAMLAVGDSVTSGTSTGVADQPTTTSKQSKKKKRSKQATNGGTNDNTNAASACASSVPNAVAATRSTSIAAVASNTATEAESTCVMKATATKETAKTAETNQMQGEPQSSSHPLSSSSSSSSSSSISASKQLLPPQPEKEESLDQAQAQVEQHACSSKQQVSGGGGGGGGGGESSKKKKRKKKRITEGSSNDGEREESSDVCNAAKLAATTTTDGDVSPVGASSEGGGGGVGGGREGEGEDEEEDEGDGSMKSAIPNSSGGSSISGGKKSVKARDKFRKCENCLSEISDRIRVCAGCKKVAYCDLRCQKSHWKTHKKSCTFAIKKFNSKEVTG